MLQIGDSLKTKNNQEIIVIEELGEGGQGCVYKVRYNNSIKALKWYYPDGMGNDKEAFYRNLSENIDRGSPMKSMAEDIFLWPIDITEWRNGVFGYVMELKPDNYFEISDFLLTNVRFTSYRVLTDAMLQIVNGFRILHSAGYCYQDINDGNFFINPETGQIRIGDTDNVAPDQSNTGILGKARYMAPEIVNGENMPNINSDRYSMALILFMLLLMTHPLEGRRVLSEYTHMTPAFEKRVYGSEPLFIMDPYDTSNGPDNVVNKNLLRVWPYLPDSIHEIFTRAFSQEVIHNPNLRIIERDWIEALTLFRNSIVVCPNCGKNEVFTIQGKGQICDKCGHTIKPKYIMQIRKNRFPCSRGVIVFRSQLGECNVEESLLPVAKIRANKAGDMAIFNESNSKWTVKTRNHEYHPEIFEGIRIMESLDIIIDGKIIKVEEQVI